MRVLAVTPYYAPEGGGLERYAHAILGRLAARGHQVETLAFTRGGLPDSHADGVSVTRARPSIILGNSPLHLGFTRRVRDRIRATRPDLVLAHTPVPFPAEMAYRAARREGVPFVATYHAGSLRGSSRLLQMMAALDRATFERQMIAGADRLIAVGPYVRDHALYAARHNVGLVPPGVDAERFHSPARSEGPGILFVAPLSRSYSWKGLDVLWNAFEQVRQRVPEATLTLVGDGDRLDEFQRRAKGHNGAVRVLGRLDEPSLVQEYRRAAVVALPSTTDAESFGMVLAEANACGRPVVASAIGGLRDFVVHGKNGLLARPGDKDDLAHKLVEILVDEPTSRAMGARGRQRVVRNHDWNNLAMSTERILKTAIA